MPSHPFKDYVREEGGKERRLRADFAFAELANIFDGAQAPSITGFWALPATIHTTFHYRGEQKGM